MSEKWKYVLALLTLTVVLCALLLARREPLPVETVEVTLGEIRRTVRLSAVVGYARKTPVAAGNSGFLTALYVKNGERVMQGQALGRIEAPLQLSAVSAALSGTLAVETALLAEALEQNVLRAPVTGVVQQLSLVENAPVQQGCIVLWIATGTPQLITTSTAEEAAQLHPGQLAQVLVDGEGRGYAEVTEVAAAEEEGAYGVLLTMLDGLTLPTGCVAEVQIVVEQHRQVPTLPLSAVTARETVWWFSDGYCTEIPANIVQTDENCAWVNLPEGLTVIPGEYKEGQRVQKATGETQT